MKKIVRHIPLVLMTVVAGLAVKSAIDYKTELDLVLEDTEESIKIPEEIRLEVEDGKALVYWVENGKSRFLTTENSLIKNL